MKKYPLKIEEIEDTEIIGYAYYSKGHHDKAEFIEAARLIDDSVSLEEVEHQYARYMPPWYAKEMCCDSYIRFGEEHGRGAFPVTIIPRW
ncbi:MAG: hypothetical protein SWK76_17120 [Actinomycetota bacterium]|nr:hypothetical protein [Actinomycetota bacterium]